MSQKKLIFGLILGLLATVGLMGLINNLDTLNTLNELSGELKEFALTICIIDLIGCIAFLLVPILSIIIKQKTTNALMNSILLLLGIYSLVNVITIFNTLSFYKDLTGESLELPAATIIQIVFFIISIIGVVVSSFVNYNDNKELKIIMSIVSVISLIIPLITALTEDGLEGLATTSLILMLISTISYGAACCYFAIQKK